MNSIKHIFVSVVTALLTMVLVHGGHTYATDGVHLIPDDYANKLADVATGVGMTAEIHLSGIFGDIGHSVGLGSIKMIYHMYMNAYFAGKFQQLHDILESGRDYHDPNVVPEFHPPQKDFNPSLESVDDLVEKCGEENVSTVCVSMRATQIYMDYVEHLQGLEDFFTVGLNDDFTTLINDLSGRAEQINEELEEAKFVMEATLAAYNEFRLAFPMHQKYQEIYKELVVYKNELEAITAEAAKFPGKFVDVSSDQCK